MSEDLEYPCEPFTPDYKLLVDESVWVDIESHRQAKRPEKDTLFKIKVDDTDEKLFFYLSYLIASKEFSSRGIYITSLLIKRNPSNYSAWTYRMECVERLKPTLASEMDFARKLSHESPKSYQAWQYRRRLCETYGDAHNELDYIKYEITTWSKNHCAWSYLTWLMTAFSVRKEQALKEMDFVQFLLASDVYNNTAWVYKNFLLEKHGHHYDYRMQISWFSADLHKMKECPWNDSLANYLIARLAQVAEKHRECLKLASCESNCLGGPRACTTKFIDNIGANTPPLLWLYYNVTDDVTYKSQLYEKLKQCDILRFP